MKKIICICIAIGLILSGLIINVNAATFDNINEPNVFVKQQKSYTCTLASVTMMLRRYAYIRGDSNWEKITEASISQTAWVEDIGVNHIFSVNKTSGGKISVLYGKIPSGNRTEVLKSLLELHPEGIVIYNTSYPHAVLLTDYTDGEFYCADPAKDVPEGRIPLNSVSRKVSIKSASTYWYVTSPQVYLDEETFNLSVNISVDGAEYNSDLSCASFDVYIDGEKIADDVTEYAAEHKGGTNYTVKDIKLGDCYILGEGGSYSGKITDETEITVPVISDHAWHTENEKSTKTLSTAAFYKEEASYTCLVCGLKAPASALLSAGAIVTYTVKEENGLVYAAPDLTAKDVLLAIEDGEMILDFNGTQLNPHKKIGSGMTLVRHNGAEETIIVKGDIDGDGSITTFDARFTLRTAVDLEKPNEWQENACNINGEENINTGDARKILRTAVELEKLNVLN